MTAEELLIHGLETTFWVSVLTIVALALRGPVTRRFGSRAAMLLWLMPALRLVAPVLTREVTAELSPTPKLPEEFTAQASTQWEAAPAGHLPLAEPVAASYTPAVAVSEAPLFVAPSTETLAALVLSLWFLGVLISAALCWARASSWRRTLLAEAEETPERLSIMAEAMAERAGTAKPFHLVVSGAAETPQIMGLGKPVLALPKRFEERYSDEEQEMALLHELTHLKRGDLRLLTAAELGFALQWFNPLTRHARRALRADQEAACDEAVRALGVNTKSYAALLVKAASIGRPVPALTLDHGLKERIIRMQNPISGPVRRQAFMLLLGASALAVAGFTASRTEVVAEHPQEEEELQKVEDEAWEEFLAERDASEDADRGEGWEDAARARAEELRARSEERRQRFEERQERAEERAQRERERAEREVERGLVRHELREGDRFVTRVGKGEHAFAFSTDDGARIRLARSGDEDDRHRIRISIDGTDDGFVLLSDPFEGLDKPAAAPPAPPAVKVKAPEVKKRTDEEGTWILVPDAPDMTEFEVDMEAFEQEMEAFGEQMEAWGEKMGNAGEAIGDLAEECEDHRRDSDEPVILEQRIEDSRDTVRAVCVSGGRERLESDEMRRFIASADISDEERRFFRRHLRRN